MLKLGIHDIAMDSEPSMLSQICGDVGVNIGMNCGDRFLERFRSLVYPPVVDVLESDVQDDLLSVIMPQGGMRPHTLVVDANGKTIMMRGEHNIPVPVRGSSPSFDLHRIFGVNAIVHAVFFHSDDDASDPSNPAIKMLIFDISECGGDDFRNVDVLQRYSRLEHIFQWAWFNLQHCAVMELCKKLQFSKSVERRELGQKLMNAQETVQGETERSVQWSPEFLNAFATYSLAELGDYGLLLHDVPEMQTIRFPIPPHIQLSHTPMGGKQCMSLRYRGDLGLAGNPTFGGVLQLPEVIKEGECAKLWMNNCSEE